MTTQIQTIKRNAKFVSYVLGHRPDEFGLITDQQGFVKIKTLLKAIHEEPEWRFLRSAHLQELILSLQPPPIEINESLIRSTDRSNLPASVPVSKPPKLVYTAVRQRAYPRVLEKGIPPGGEGYVILTPSMAMANRLGKRIDNAPIILTVQCEAAQNRGVSFQQYGHLLFLADFIPSATFTGPALPKEREQPVKPETQQRPIPPLAPGSYFPDPATYSENTPGKKRRRQKEKEWQKQRRQARKHKGRNKPWPG